MDINNLPDKVINFIFSKDYRKYLDWGEIGERLVSRAIQILSKNT